MAAKDNIVQLDKSERKLLLLHENPELLNKRVSVGLSQVVWGGHPHDTAELTIEDDGKLSYRGEIRSETAICEDPQKWTPDIFKGVTEYGQFLVEGGASLPSINSWAHLTAWNWSTFDAQSDNWWATSISFASQKVPISWWLPIGNFLITTDSFQKRIWRIKLSSGRRSFFFGLDERWFLLLETAPGKAPELQEVADLLTAVSFTIGEPIKAGLFHQLGNDCGITGLAGLLLHSPDAKSSQPPALPARVEPDSFVRFVEQALVFIADNPKGILHLAMNSYLYGLLENIEVSFLLLCSGLEALAKWMKENEEIRTHSSLILVHEAAEWKKWVKKNKDEIKAFAIEEQKDRFFQKVMASYKDVKPVENVFKGLELNWTTEMGDVQRRRDLVVHTGKMNKNGQRDWDLDRSRVGLTQTMLTALIAKVIGYDGPIADRSQTCFNIGDDKQPDWWSSPKLDV